MEYGIISITLSSISIALSLNPTFFMILWFYLLTTVLCIGMLHLSDQSRYISRTLKNSNQHLEF